MNLTGKINSLSKTDGDKVILTVSEIEPAGTIRGYRYNEFEMVIHESDALNIRLGAGVNISITVDKAE